MKKTRNKKEEILEVNLWRTIVSEDLSLLNKRFLLAYNLSPDILKIKSRIHMAKAQKLLMEKYGLGGKEFSHVRNYKSSDGGRTRKGFSCVFCHVKPGLMIEITPECVELAYSKIISYREIVELKKIFSSCVRKRKESQRKFYMVKQDPFSGLDLEEFDVRFDSVPLEENYNEDLLKIHPRIVNYLEEGQSSGLILLHGTPGSGKTTYLRHLIASCNTRFIYMPTNLFHHLVDPSFFSFISQQPNSVILLEDCEELLKSRTENQNSGISTLLNLSDGLLGDALKIKIVCTFNMDFRNIDTALLRKGRLLYRYEFGSLSLEKTNNLLRRLNSEVVSLKPLTLAEIYNYSEPNGVEQDLIKQKKIGFG